ncbi:LOW QUALITY PROTEIN: hypothetical protein PHMEG_00039946 [Phytophthora megakarya]|uniref:Uncharacterized protein n=1 Tax=Phytophthora megakarya TaxID=4795 RepID=A0A225UFV9_9STRA|nr:LOW QUALITY PROTEIN: hypothetical protein PHMEG_00039946 [Phytophthora megakarya]
MPRKLPWSEVVTGASVSDGNEFLETFKAYKVTRSQPTTCSICTNPLLHTMQYMLLTCTSARIRANYKVSMAGQSVDMRTL